MKFCRFLSLIMAFLLLLSALASCSSQNENEGESEVSTTGAEESLAASENTTEVPEEDEEVHPLIEKKNYGEEFYFTIQEINRSKLYWVEESSGDLMTDAIYNRQVYVRDYLGVEMYGTSVSDPDLYTAQMQNAVKNKDDSMHLMISHPYYQVSGFISGNYLTDFNDIDVIDLEKDYWNLELMEQLSLNGKLHLGFGDFNIGITSVIAYNKDLYDKYSDAIDENFYTLVDEYRWTLDKMISIASLISIDNASDGKTVDDTFGLVGDYDLGYVILLQASDINLIEQNEKGDYVVSVLSERTKERTADLCSKFFELVRSPYAAFYEEISIEVPREIFKDNRALMRFTETHLLPDLLTTGMDFGVLPYPMYDENQKDVGYRHMQWGGYLCIPAYLKNPDMVYETIELVSFASESVNVAYYDRLLGKQVADAPDDRRMLSIVWDSLCSDIGFTYQSIVGGEYYMLMPKVTAVGSSGNLASFVARFEASANKKLAKFVQSTSKNN